MLVTNVANPTAITSIRLLLITLTSLYAARESAFRRADPSRLGRRARSHSAGVGLRQVYAELDGRSAPVTTSRGVCAQVHGPRQLKTVLNFACVETGRALRVNQ